MGQSQGSESVASPSYNIDAQRLVRQNRLQQLHGNLAAAYTGDNFANYAKWQTSSIQQQADNRQQRLAQLRGEPAAEPFRRLNPQIQMAGESFGTFTKWVGSSLEAQERNRMRRLRQLSGDEPFGTFTKWPTPNLALQHQQPLWKSVGQAVNIDNPYEVWSLEQMKGTLTYRVTSPNGSVQYNMLQDRPLRNGNLIYPKNNFSLKLRVKLPNTWY